jgi:hypothetical protein
MLGLGSIVSALGKKFTQTVMNAGAVLVVVLGLAMLSQGGSLSGFLPQDLLLPIILGLCALGLVLSIPFKRRSDKIVSALAVTGAALILVFSWSSLLGYFAGAPAGESEGIKIENGVQLISSKLSSGSYPAITVQEGTPVKWTIDAEERDINGCNNRMLILEYGIEHSFTAGENVIEFTPTRTGNFRYSCWMGMIRGSITVAEAPDAAPADSAAAFAPQNGPPTPVTETVPVPTALPTDPPTDPTTDPPTAVYEEPDYDAFAGAACH